MTIRTEHKEQVAVFNWVQYNLRRYPELQLLFAIPNGGNRDPITGAMMKREGVQRGVPDLFLPVSRQGYHGLFIEVKKKGLRKTTSPHQKRWHRMLAEQRYLVDVCEGAEETIRLLEFYLAPTTSTRRP